MTTRVSAGLTRCPSCRFSGVSQRPISIRRPLAFSDPCVLRSACDDAKKYPGRLGIDPGLSVADALRAITHNAAYSLRQEAQTGSLEPGKFADLIVLDRNLLHIDSTAIAGTRCY